MGVVYLAEQLRLKRKVALKLVAPELAGDERFRERLLRESELAASIDHPNVLPVYDAGEAEGTLYVAMRYVEGSDLARLLAEQGALEPARAVSVCERVADALDTAHARGLVHRDVKPGNVLISQTGHVYLADFGLTRSTAQPGVVEQSHFGGSVDYVAPEQIEGQPVDGRADQYALACVLYHCLTGKPPFRRDSVMATLWAHLDEEPPAAGELPRALDPVLATALAKDPAERYPTCRELVDHARDALGLEKHQPLYRRKEVLLAAGGLLAAAAIAPSILLTRGKTDAEPEIVLPITTDAVLELDPETGKPVAAIEAGIAGPGDLAFGERAVWVANFQGATVARIDPETAQGTGSTGGLGAAPNDIAVGEGGVWTTSLDGTLTKIDPQTLTRRLSVVLSDVDPVALAVGFGAVWVAARTAAGGFVIRVEPASGRTLQTTPLTGRCTGIAAGEGAVWAATRDPGATSLAGAIVRLDPATGQAVTEVRLDLPPAGIAAGTGGVWVALGFSTDGAAVRIDPATNSVADSIPLAYVSNVAGVAVSPGVVWVTETDTGILARIDTSSRTVERLRLGGGVAGGGFPTDVAVGGDTVWTTIGKTITP
jgi:streptogramin lyase